MSIVVAGPALLLAPGVYDNAGPALSFTGRAGLQRQVWPALARTLNRLPAALDAQLRRDAGIMSVSTNPSTSRATSPRASPGGHQLTAG